MEKALRSVHSHRICSKEQKDYRYVPAEISHKSGNIRVGSHNKDVDRPKVLLPEIGKKKTDQESVSRSGVFNIFKDAIQKPGYRTKQ